MHEAAAVVLHSVLTDGCHLIELDAHDELFLTARHKVWMWSLTPRASKKLVNDRLACVVCYDEIFMFFGERDKLSQSRLMAVSCLLNCLKKAVRNFPDQETFGDSFINRLLTVSSRAQEKLYFREVALKGLIRSLRAL